MMKHHSYIAQLVCLALCLTTLNAHPIDLTPDTWSPNWNADHGDVTYQEWDIFNTPTGTYGGFAPNLPDYGNENPHQSSFGPEAYDTTDTSFITSNGNIYSFNDPLQMVVNIPQANQVGHITTVAVQLRTQGSDLDLNTFTIGDIRPSHVGLLYVEDSGSAFGGNIIDSWSIFYLPHNTNFTLEFSSPQSSLSTDIIRVDTFSTPAENGFPQITLQGDPLLPENFFFEGDTNFDGTVNLEDLAVLATHFGQTQAAVWEQGDFTGDNAVNLEDLAVLATFFGQSTTPPPASEPLAVSTSIPEPSSALLLSLIALTACTRNSRKTTTA